MSYETEVTADSPIQFWKFSETTGTTAATSNGGTAGSYVGSYTLGQAGPGGRTAVTLNGGNIDLPVPANFSAGWSIEMWVKTASASVPIIALAYNNAWWLGVSGDHVATWSNAVAGGAAINDGLWHQIVIVRQSDYYLRIHVDGVQVAIGAQYGDLSFAPGGGHLRVGQFGDGGGYSFPGSVACLSLYTTALSASRIEAHFAAMTPPTKMILFDGDSYTNSVGASSGAGTIGGTAYEAVALSKLGAAWTGINLGRPGYAISDMIADAATRVDALVNLATYPTTWITCQGGINDNANVGQIDPAVIQTRQKTYCLARRAANPGVKIVLIGMPLDVRYGNNYLAVAAAVNAWDRINYPDFADRFVDLAADPRIQDPTASPPFYGDNLHFGDAGNAIFAGLVARAVTAPTSVLPRPEDVKDGFTYGPGGNEYMGTNTGESVRQDFPIGGGLQAYTVAAAAAEALAIAPTSIVDWLCVTIVAAGGNTSAVYFDIVGQQTAAAPAESLYSAAADAQKPPLAAGETRPVQVDLRRMGKRYAKFSVRCWRANAAGAATVQLQASC